MRISSCEGVSQADRRIGSIWQAVNPFTGQSAAVKVQDVDHECPTNRYERNFYPSLQGGKGMPTLWAAGVQGDHDYLGTALFIATPI